MSEEQKSEKEIKLERAKEIDKKTQSITPAEQKRLALLLSDVIETGLTKHELSPEDHEFLTEQVEGMRLGIELDF